MTTLKTFKKVYDRMNNDYIRSMALMTAEKLHVRKDVIRVDTNNFCNIQCIMCSSKSWGHANRQIMSLEDYKTVVDRFKRTARFFYISCGFEPLATPHFEKYLEYAKETGLPFISFCTNGTLLNDRIIRCLVDGQINEITISIDGFTKEDYNRIMAGSDFDKVMDNIRALNAYKKEKNSIYPEIRINSILMKSNLLRFDALLEFVKVFDVKTLQLFDMIVGEVQNNETEVKREMISNIDQNELTDILQKVKTGVDELKCMGKEIILPRKLLNMEIDKQKQTNQKRSCVIPFFCYWIRADGKIEICRSKKQGVIGNFFSDDWAEITLKRNVIRRMTLQKKCPEGCTINSDTSTIV